MRLLTFLKLRRRLSGRRFSSFEDLYKAAIPELMALSSASTRMHLKRDRDRWNCCSKSGRILWRDVKVSTGRHHYLRGCESIQQTRLFVFYSLALVRHGTPLVSNKCWPYFGCTYLITLTYISYVYHFYSSSSWFTVRYVLLPRFLLWTVAAIHGRMRERLGSVTSCASSEDDSLQINVRRYVV